MKTTNNTRSNRLGWTATIVGSLLAGATAFGVTTLLSDTTPAHAAETQIIDSNIPEISETSVEITGDSMVEAAATTENSDNTETIDELQWFYDLAEYGRDWVCTMSGMSGGIHPRGMNVFTSNLWREVRDSESGYGSSTTVIGLSSEEIHTNIENSLADPEYFGISCYNSSGDTIVHGSENPLGAIPSSTLFPMIWP